jgi:hypothetical protein
MGWGDNGQYYARDPHDGVVLDALARHWAGELLRANPEAKSDVERAVKQWNAAVRDQLRNETGLRLSTPGDVRMVPVRVTDGLPIPVHDVLKDLPELALLLLALSEIQQASRGTAYLRREYEAISRLIPEAPKQATRDEVGHTHVLAEVLLAKLAELNLKERWSEIREDMLGAYFFQVPIVQIYWVPIGLIATTLRVPPQLLTLVALGHELAHAYTHLGRDIDGFRWDADDLASTDLDIVEGLAEFYCRAVCDALNERSSGARGVFDKLQEWSAGPYLAYRRWLEGEGDPGEIVRATMIEGRRTSIKETARFETVLDEYRRNLTGRRRSASQGS